MAKLRAFVSSVVLAHWAVAMWHLVLAANVLPPPDNNVRWLAVILLTLLHWGVLVPLWMLSDRLIGWASLGFFSAALSADLYEHFLHSSLNNVFMVMSTDWTAWFKASVYILLALEILGLSLGVWSLGRRARGLSNPKPGSNLRTPRHTSLRSTRNGIAWQ
jgi:hypothetical protein